MYLKNFKLLLINFVAITCFTGINSATTIENEIYNGAQLIRITEFPNKMIHNLTEQLEIEFDSPVWKISNSSIDVIVKNHQISNVTKFFNDYNLVSNVLVPDVQKLINKERRRSRRSTDMNWNQYHSAEIISNYLDEIKNRYPNLVEIYEIGKSIEGFPLKVLQISTNPSENKKIWLDGGIHAREWIAPAAVTYVINELLSNWENSPGYITNKTWYIMPLVNPDGYEYSRNVDRMWRKNRRKIVNSECYGVDLNRNFNVDWKSQNQARTPCSSIYRGRKPFSEPEAMAVARFIRKNRDNLDAFLTFHSYGQYILYPWGFKRTRLEDYSRLQEVGNLAALKIKSLTGTLYRVSQSNILGLISGASDDWCRQVIGTKYSYTIELQDTGVYGFLLPESNIASAGEEALAISDTIASAISADNFRNEERLWH